MKGLVTTLRAGLICCVLLPCLPGCGQDKLETGYVYTPLGDSTSKRRGYYADPFSPEARAAQAERPADAADAGGRRVPGQ